MDDKTIIIHKEEIKRREFAALFFAKILYFASMKKVALETIGCRLNQYDTERIAAGLAGYGFRRVPFFEAADLYIINTCTVTGRADASCRQVIARAVRQCGTAPVVVVGCYVDAEPAKIARLDGVDLLIANSRKASIVEILKSNFPELFESEVATGPITGINEFYNHNRAWIKIGDGCNQRCAYCIVPAVRGALTNRHHEEILGEIKNILAGGFNEIVLTGVHIGQYACQHINSLTGLIEFILRETMVARLRLSSIEPQEITPELIRIISDNRSRICGHLHIPLQSGSDRILQLMRRPYKQFDYLELIERVKTKIIRCTIGADIIVGFPGESVDDFRETVKVAESGFLDYMHVFSYSDRPGTEASNMKGKVDSRTIKERNATLRDISERNYLRALEREPGREISVISEHRSDEKNRYWGITDNYLKVLLPEGVGGGKELLSLNATTVEENYLIASPK